MRMTRRTFLLSSGLVVTSEVLANLPVPGVLSEAETAPNDVVFKIQGWSPAGNEANAMWIAFGPSWRSAWR
jgi:hypothetical protein